MNMCTLNWFCAYIQMMISLFQITKIWKWLIIIWSFYNLKMAVMLFYYLNQMFYAILILNYLKLKSNIIIWSLQIYLTWKWLSLIQMFFVVSDFLKFENGSQYTVQLYTIPVYSTVAHKTCLKNSSTQNQFTAWVYILKTSLQHRCTQYSFQ